MRILVPLTLLGISVLLSGIALCAEPPVAEPMSPERHTPVRTIGFSDIDDRRTVAVERLFKAMPESLDIAIEIDSQAPFDGGLAFVLLPSTDGLDRSEITPDYFGAGMYFANTGAEIPKLSPWPLAAMPPQNADLGEMRRWVSTSVMINHYWGNFQKLTRNAQHLGSVNTQLLANHNGVWRVLRTREDGQRFPKPTSYLAFPLLDANPPKSNGSDQPDPDRNGPFQSRIFSDLPFENWGTHHELIVPKPVPQSTWPPQSYPEWIVVPERLSKLDPPIVVFAGEDAQGKPSTRDWRITHSALPGEVDHARIIVIFDNISDADLLAALASIPEARPEAKPSVPDRPGP